MYTNPQDLHKHLFRNLKPSMRYTSGDPIQWQQAARARLRELLVMPEKSADDALIIEWTRDTADYTETRFTFQTEDNYRAVAHMLLPHGVEKPIPMICLQGHSTGMHVSLGQVKYEGDQEDIDGGRDFAIQAVHQGYAAFALELRAFGECGGTEKGPACNHPAYAALMLGRTLQGERVFDTMRLIDVIQAHFADKVNVDKFGIMGNSGGSTCSFYTAALDERIVLPTISCAFCSYYDSIIVMQHCPCNYVPRLAQAFDMGDIACLIAPRPLIILNGRHDPSFPWQAAAEQLEITRSFYDKAFGSSDQVLHIVGPQGHQFYPALAWPEMNRLMP